ncbi:L-rhamnose/proton symporter RhaT [Aridibaculum aurantiacum]|uniref:L-rhamnose/proton symporter RhaT n=1 Tax=Aridibaculum aurantiacum TaxID=2810307 RepID=UPI001A97C498|nr:L-rhamnose/proton symporter RhaT [Aridibaculum aurantiacum]
MDVITGVLLHAIGATSAALCYTPQKKVVRWSWQTYWLAQAFICWLLLPIVVALITIPNIAQVLSEAPTSAMVRSFALGAAYGVGGTAFGLAIRYLGFSLTYAISVGISCVLGTLLPPFIRGELNTIVSRYGAEWIMYGIAIGVLGIILCGSAGRLKEKDISNQQDDTSFSFAKGLPLSIMAGVLSAFYGFALDQGQPIADVAAKYGAGNLQGNVIYIFSNTGAFITTLIYCLYLHKKHRTAHEYTSVGGGKQRLLTFNYALAILTGFLWYGQFFFYGLGHVRMGTYQFSSWAIHMIMLVLFSAVAGLLMREWSRVQKRTAFVLALALLVLIAAVLTLTYGNYLGSVPAAH